MSEQGTEFTDIEVEDIEVEDTEGHLRLFSMGGPDEDDVEGHVQPPRGDDTDHVLS
jgi:hypothetical protein